MYWNTLIDHRCGLKAVSYALDSMDPKTPLDVGIDTCDLSEPRFVPEELEEHMTVPADTRFASV